MRSVKNLIHEFKINNLKVDIKPLEGGCIGFGYQRHNFGKVKAIVENTGYCILKKYQYIHTFKVPAHEVDSIPNLIAY